MEGPDFQILWGCSGIPVGCTRRNHPATVFWVNVRWSFFQHRSVTCPHPFCTQISQQIWSFRVVLAEAALTRLKTGLRSTICQAREQLASQCSPYLSIKPKNCSCFFFSPCGGTHEDSHAKKCISTECVNYFSWITAIRNVPFFFKLTVN